MKSTLNTKAQEAKTKTFTFAQIKENPGVYRPISRCQSHWFVSGLQEQGVVVGFYADGSPFHPNTSWLDDTFILSNEKLILTFQN